MFVGLGFAKIDYWEWEISDGLGAKELGCII